jgi:hypothetical protein
LRELEQAKAELARRERERPRVLSAEDRRRLLALGVDLQSVWEAPTTTARDRKELLRTLLEEVIITVFKAAYRARLTLRWRGGSLPAPIPTPPSESRWRAACPTRGTTPRRRTISLAATPFSTSCAPSPA